MKLQVKPTEYGIEEKKANELTKGLDVVIKEREHLIGEFNEISLLEVTEENIPKFKELRLKIVKNRTQGINKWHKASKEFFLAGGRFVDAIKNKENQINEQMEAKLMDAEKHFENLEKERIEKLNKERIEKIMPYVEDVFGLDLGNMAEDVFNAYYESKKKEHEERLETERKAEAERIENERKQKVLNERLFEISKYGNHAPTKPLLDTSEKDWKELLRISKENLAEYEAKQEKIRKENERLKKEAEERDRLAKLEEEKRTKQEAERKAKEDVERKEREEKQRKEREAYEAKLKSEREERERVEQEERQKREKLEAELKAKQEAERKAKEEEEARLQAELNKGDADKVKDLISELEALKSKYTFKSEKNKKMYNDVAVLLDKTIQFINK